MLVDNVHCMLRLLGAEFHMLVMVYQARTCKLAMFLFASCPIQTFHV